MQRFSANVVLLLANVELACHQLQTATDTDNQRDTSLIV